MLTPLFLEVTEAEDAALAATLTDSLVVRAATKKLVTACPSPHDLETHPSDAMPQ